jgi:hypothetical protein
MANRYLNYGVDSTPITGRYLAHNHHNRVVRAFLAGDLALGARQLIKPTLVQAALLAGVNRTYAFWATKRMAERAEIEAGRIPLVPAMPRPNGNGSALVSDAIDDAVVFDLVRNVGIEKVLTIAAAVEQAQHR